MVEVIPGIDIVDKEFLNCIVALLLYRDLDEELLALLTKINEIGFWDISLQSNDQEIKKYKSLIKVATKIRLDGKSIQAARESLKNSYEFYDIITDVEKNLPLIDFDGIIETLKRKIKLISTFKFIVGMQNILPQLQKFGTLNDELYTKIMTNVERLYDEITFDFTSSETIYSNIEDVERRFERREKEIKEQQIKRSIIPSGLSLINASFSNMSGYSVEKLYMISSPTGKGKTRFVIFEGVNAFKLGFNVLHITIENSSQQIEDIYDTAFLGMPMEKIYSMLRRTLSSKEAMNEIIKIKEEIKNSLSKFDNELRIKKFHPYKVTPAMIENYLKRRISSGFKPDLVIIDHLDLIIPSSGMVDNLFLKGELVVSELKDIAERYKVAILLPSQIGREGVRQNRNSNDLKTLGGEDVSRSMAKNELVDFSMTINQNDQETISNVARLFIDKNRDGIDKIIIPIKFDKGTMQLSCIIDKDELILFDDLIRKHVQLLVSRLAEFNEDYKDKLMELKTIEVKNNNENVIPVDGEILIEKIIEEISNNKFPIIKYQDSHDPDIDILQIGNVLYSINKQELTYIFNKLKEENMDVYTTIQQFIEKEEIDTMQHIEDFDIDDELASDFF